MGVAICTRGHQRVLSVPSWPTKPPAPTFVIAAATLDTTTTGEVTRQEREVFYPGEGFAGVSLADCMINRVQRTRTELTWMVEKYRQVSLVGVDTTLPANPRPQSVVTSGSLLENWQTISYAPTALVPPLDNSGLIPNCGGYFDLYAITNTTVSAVDQRPVVADLSNTPWQTEAERVRDQFPWQNYRVATSAQGQFLVRALPLTQETLQDYVYPHDIGRSYNGVCGMDENFLWVPPAGQWLDDTPWRQEVEAWQQTVDWLAVVAQCSGVTAALLNQWGQLALLSKAADQPPTWQVEVTWSGLPGALAAVGFDNLTLAFANQGESRLVAVAGQPDGGWRETRQLVRRSSHPLTAALTEEVIFTGTRTLAGDQTTYHPHWKVEPYEEITP